MANPEAYTTYLGNSYYEWTSFERGFDVPTAFMESVRVGFHMPRCDMCQDFPEKLEIGRLVRPLIHEPSGRIIHMQHLDTEVRIECHGHRWSFQGSQAAAYLNAMFEPGPG
jgi:hypothetical protein